jgi:hypothetical protein
MGKGKGHQSLSRGSKLANYEDYVTMQTAIASVSKSGRAAASSPALKPRSEETSSKKERPRILLGMLRGLINDRTVHAFMQERRNINGVLYRDRHVLGPNTGASTTATRQVEPDRGYMMRTSFSGPKPKNVTESTSTPPASLLLLSLASLGSHITFYLDPDIAPFLTYALSTFPPEVVSRLSCLVERTDDALLQCFSSCSDIVHLSVWGDAVTDAGLAFLCPRLEDEEAADAGGGAEDWEDRGGGGDGAKLYGVPELESLELCLCERVTLHGVSRLLRSLRLSLKRVSLFGTSFDYGADELEAFKDLLRDMVALEAMDVRGCEFSAATVRFLKTEYGERIGIIS